MVRRLVVLAWLVLVCRVAAASSSGGLYAMSGGTSSTGAPVVGPPLPMVDSSIAIEVRGPLVEGVITQRFSNPGDRAIEAVYIFPLPADAILTAAELRIGARTIHAAIERRAAAQRRYEAAVAAGVPAALLEAERPDVFTQTVTAIPAHGAVEVTLRFDALARGVSGRWELVVPMVVAPRFVPGTASGRPTTGGGRAPDTDRAPDASRITPPSGPGGSATTVRLRFAGAVREVASASHELTVSVVGGQTVATLADPRSDHDAIIRWRAGAAAAGWVEAGGGASGAGGAGGFAAVVVEAPAASGPHPAVRCALVLQRAATTAGDAEAMGRPLVAAVLGAMGGGDRVALVGPGGGPGGGTGGGTGGAAGPWRVAAALARELEAGWTRPTGEVFDLTRALGRVPAGAAAVLVVSDGLVADDAAVLAAARRLGVPVHVLGIGPAPARGLLGALAATTGGTARFVAPSDELDALPAIARDVVADLATPPAPLAVNWGQLGASEVAPATLPRLGAGQAAVVVARVARAVAGQGRANGEVFAISLAPPAARASAGMTVAGPLGRRWARGRLDAMIAAGASAAAIADHALAYGLVSPETALVAIGEEVVVEGGVSRTITVPVAVPSGMAWPRVRKAVTVETGEDDARGDLGGEDQAKAAGPAAGRSGGYRAPPADKRPVAEGTAAGAAGAASAPDASDGRIDPSAAPAAAPPAEPRVLADSVETESTTIMVSDSGGVGRRLALALGGGVADGDGVVTLALRDEAARLGGRIELTLGGRAALWLVGGRHPRGLALAELGLSPWRLIEVAVGLGVHLGDDSGPALGLELRLARGRLAPWLRYDGAVLLHPAGAAAAHAATAGVEWRW
jgi:Ca-activated chloride channel family protein